jgi:NADH-quinone oxidoreductase subunit H
MECSINALAVCLRNGGMNPGLADFIAMLLGVVLIMSIPLVLVILLIWVERKFAARIQDRIGPNRVGPFGLLQNIADAVKLITKEDITPAGADRVIYNVAPVLMVVSALLVYAVIPFSPIHVGVNLESGALYFVAATSLGTLAIMTAGWASNNKYALLGAFRTIALLISYEVPLVLSLLLPVMLAGSMRLQDIVNAQWGMWFFFMAPAGALLFFLANQAEAGRAPFDIIEAESELVAGFNIEYSGMKFGLFMAGEFIHPFTNGLLMAVLFTGGWIGPWALEVPVLGIVYLLIKTAFWYLISLLIRNTVPRVRIDQMMYFNWRWLVPGSIAVVLVTAFLIKVMQVITINGSPIAPDLGQPGLTFGQVLPMTVVLFVVNLAMVVPVLNRVRSIGREERLAEQTSREGAAAAAGH